MSEDARRPEYTPLNLHPFVGLDLGERWGREVGELSQRLTHVEQAVNRLETKTDALDAKFDAKFDALQAKVEEIARTVARHDERFASLERSLDDRFARVDDKFASLERSMDERFARVDDKFAHVDDKFASLERSVDSRFASLEKKLDSNTRLLWGMFTAMLAAIIIQKFI